MCVANILLFAYLRVFWKVNVLRIWLVSCCRSCSFLRLLRGAHVCDGGNLQIYVVFFYDTCVPPSYISHYFFNQKPTLNCIDGLYTVLTLVSQRKHSILIGVIQCMKLSINITMHQKYFKQLRTTLPVKRTLYLVYLWYSISRYMYLILQGLCKYAFSCIFEQTVKNTFVAF